MTAMDHQPLQGLQLYPEYLRLLDPYEDEEEPAVIKQLYKRADEMRMPPCTGFKDKMIKKWVINMDVAYKSISTIPEAEREQLMMSFLGLTVNTWIGSVLLEKIGKVEERRTWAFVRKVAVEECLEDAEMLRFNLRNLVQAPAESVYTFNQRYATDLPWAFEDVQLEQPIVQEFLVTDYIRGLREEDIRYKTLIKQPKSVTDAMFAAEHAEYVANVVKDGSEYRTAKPYTIVSYRQTS